MTNLAEINKEELQRLLRSSSTDKKILSEIANSFFYSHDFGFISELNLPLKLTEILDDPELSSEMLDLLYKALPEGDFNSATVDVIFYKIATHPHTSKNTLIALTSYLNCADVRWEALIRLIRDNNYNYELLAKLSDDPCFDIKLKVADLMNFDN